MSKNPTKEDLRAEYEGQVVPKKKKVKKKKEKVIIKNKRTAAVERRKARVARRVVKALDKGKNKKAARIAKRQKKRIARGNTTRVGQVLRKGVAKGKKIAKTVDKISKSNVGKVIKGAVEAAPKVIRGDLRGAYEVGKRTVATLNKKPKLSMKKPKMAYGTGMVKPMLSNKKKTSKLARLERKGARKAAAINRKLSKMNRKTALRDKLARGLYDKHGSKDYYSKVKGDPSSLSSGDKRTIRKINKLYRSEGRKDRAIQRKVRRLNRIAKRVGHKDRLGVQSGDPLNNYKPYKR